MANRILKPSLPPSRFDPSKYSIIFFTAITLGLILVPNDQISLIIFSLMFAFLGYKRNQNYGEFLFSIILLFFFFLNYGLQSKTLVLIILMLFSFYALRFVSLGIMGASLAGLIPIVFYISAMTRDHPLVSENLPLFYFISQLIIGRLNMVEPFLRISEQVELYRGLLIQLPLSNSIFPSLLIETLPSVRVSDEHLAVFFGRKFYGTSDTYVSSGLLGELYGNYGFGGTLYFFVLGLICRAITNYNSQQKSFFSLAIFLYFHAWVVFIGFETYIALSWSQFIQFFFISYLIAVFLNLTKIRHRDR
ncbi:hypothetical protein OAC57_05700 [Planktomarina temperata]|nr:hypothetical protein [Planktomarina temperata]